MDDTHAQLRTPALNPEQIHDFAASGCLVVRRAFDSAETAMIDAWCHELLSMPEESGRHWVYHETSLTEPGRDLVGRIENFTPFHPGLAELANVLAVPVGQLLGEEAVLFKEKINFKMPGGDGFKPHQDSQAGWDTYADFFISVLVCIDPATEENGCLRIASGHHKRGLFKSWEPLSEADMADMSFVPCPTAPGDLIFFDNYAPHASEPNMSSSTRRLYYATYNALSAGDYRDRYYADKHRSYPPDIDREPGRTYTYRV